MNPIGAFLFGVFLLCSACAGRIDAPQVLSPGQPIVSIYVVNEGKHAGLAVRRADIPRGLWPESGDFPEADYLEVGWGDKDYYQAEDPGLWLALKAAFWSSGAVLHLVGVKGDIAGRFGGYEIIRLDLEPHRFLRLADYIHGSFARNGAEKATPIGRGQGGDGLFYPATGQFHLFNTCNGWVARALEAAGYPMGIFRPLTADQLMAKMRPFAAPSSP